jgi:hypothetical protein
MPLISLVLQYNFLHGWNQLSILGRDHAPYFNSFKSWFRVHDIAVNCVYASGWGIMGDLASRYDPELALECYENQQMAESGILTWLYNPERKSFHHVWYAPDGTQRRHLVRTVQSLFPLLLKSLPNEALEEILRLLNDPDEFGTTYMVPSVARAEIEYNPVADNLLLWRGPIWGFTNWFIMEGLEKQGRRYDLESLG